MTMFEYPASDESPAEATEPEWKQALRERFEEWLAMLEAPPEDEAFDDDTDTPDLYTFQSDLSALASEFRKSNRRTAEAMKQWSDLMGGFQNELARVTQKLDDAPDDSPVPAAHWTDLIDFADRLTRIEAAFEQTPRPAWLGRDQEWRSAWQRQSEAFAILASHLQELLQRAHITRVDTVGQPIDLRTMRVVETTSTHDHPAETVLRIIRPGYLRNDQVIRLAEVTVAINEEPGTRNQERI